MKKIDQQIVLKILVALHWSEQQYMNFIEATGRAYLDALFEGYDAVKKQITSTETFWDWWKFHWEQREKEFIETLETYPESITNIEMLYNDIHDPVCLADGMYLNGQVLQESYANMIAETTKSKSKYETA